MYLALVLVMYLIISRVVVPESIYTKSSSWIRDAAYLLIASFSSMLSEDLGVEFYSNEPSTFLTLLTSTHSGNISRFNNPAYDKVLAQASTENTVKARNADYNAAEKILMEQAPIAPIYQYTNGRLIKPWLKGYPINNPEDVAYSRTMYIVKH